MLARNLATTAASRIIALPLSFAASLALARLLGAEQRGVLALAILIPTTIYLFGGLGLATAQVVFAGKHPEKRGAIAFQSIAFSVCLGLVTLCFYWYVLEFRPVWFERFEVVGVRNHILAAFIVLFYRAYSNLSAGVLGANRIPVVNIAEVLVPFSKMALVVALVWWLNMSVTGGVLVHLGSFVFLAVYMAIATMVKVPVRTWKPDLAFFTKSITFGLKNYLHHVALFFASRIGIFMVAYLIADSDRAVGHFTLASQFAIMIWVLPQSMQTTFLPHLSVTQADRGKLSVRMTRILFLALIPVFVALVLGSPVIPLLAGQDYAESVAPFVWFLPGMLLLGAIQPLGAYLTYIEKPMYGVFAVWMGAVVNVVSNYVLIPRMGISGAAVALSLSNLMMGVIIVGCFRYETKIPLSLFALRWSDVNEILGMANKVINKVARRRSTKT